MIVSSTYGMTRISHRRLHIPNKSIEFSVFLSVIKILFFLQQVSDWYSGYVAFGLFVLGGWAFIFNTGRRFLEEVLSRALLGVIGKELENIGVAGISPKYTLRFRK